MAKFAIECPQCGSYAEGRTGFFARKKIDCSCGYTIDVKTEKLALMACPHCGNQVDYDQSRGDKARCPVCKQNLGSSVDKASAERFRCPRCSCALHADSAAVSYSCPVCDELIDVQKAISLARIAKEGIASVIKYEGDNNTFVWKHPVEDFNIGSQLIVHESQVAIFFRDGQALDTFASGRYSLETQSIPLVNQLYDSQLEPSGMFHSEVYFVNMTTQMGIKWGTDSNVRLFDPVTGIPIEIGARGEFNIRCDNARQLLLRIVGTEAGLDRSQLLSSGVGDGVDGSAAGLGAGAGGDADGAGAGSASGGRASGGGGASGYFRSFIMTRVKSHLARSIKESQINILEIDEHLDELSDALRERINQGLAEYGLTMPEFFVEQVTTPDDDKNFQALKRQHAEMYLKPREEAVLQAEAVARREREVVEAQTEAQKKIIDSQARAQADVIEAQGTSEAYRLQAQAEAAEMQMKGYTYAQETARQVGLEAMQGGIAGGGSGGGGGGGFGGGIGDVVGLGVALGAMGGVMGMTKDALTPIIGSSQELGQGFGAVVNPAAGGAGVGAGAGGQPGGSWDCACGGLGLTANFCPNCGSRRPAQPLAWDCPGCGAMQVNGNFCPNCGVMRPDHQDAAAPLATPAPDANNQTAPATAAAGSSPHPPAQQTEPPADGGGEAVDHE